VTAFYAYILFLVGHYLWREMNPPKVVRKKSPVLAIGVDDDVVLMRGQQPFDEIEFAPLTLDVVAAKHGWEFIEPEPAGYVAQDEFGRNEIVLVRDEALPVPASLVEKANRGEDREAKLVEAAQLVLKGTSVRQAAKQMSVPESTVRSRVKKLRASPSQEVA